ERLPASRRVRGPAAPGAQPRRAAGGLRRALRADPAEPHRHRGRRARRLGARRDARPTQLARSRAAGRRGGDRRGRERGARGGAGAGGPQETPRQCRGSAGLRRKDRQGGGRRGTPRRRSL
ncbi:MAG: hypothetical protein AVDCRST_MAG53-1540, partial [uncultured Solirubrobacteraceae bacterium]